MCPLWISTDKQHQFAYRISKVVLDVHTKPPSSRKNQSKRRLNSGVGPVLSSFQVDESCSLCESQLLDFVFTGWMTPVTVASSSGVAD
jgi:hypothetical protein